MQSPEYFIQRFQAFLGILAHSSCQCFWSYWLNEL